MTSHELGGGPDKQEGKEKDVTIEEDLKFKAFVCEMRPEIEAADPSVDELVEKYKAWKLYSVIYSDPSMVKAKVFKPVSKKEVNAALMSVGVVCFHCKEAVCQ